MTDETTQVEVPAPDAAVPEMVQADSSPAIENEGSPIENGDDTAAGTEAKKPHWSQKRIDELTRNWREEQRRSEALLQMVQQQKPVEAPKAAEPVKLPSLEEFGYDEAKYQAALLEYADRRAEAVVERRLSEAEKQRAEQTVKATFIERQQKFIEANPDYVGRVLDDPTAPLTPEIVPLILQSENGPELAYWLSTNREQGVKLSQLAKSNPMMAAVEFGRIEGRLAAMKEVKTRPVPVVTKAPPPPPRVEETETSVAGIKTSDPASDKLSDAEWRAQREKELKRKKA